MSEIVIIQNVLKANDELAADNRRRLRSAGVLAVNLIGAPGCGKTTLLEATLRRLDGELRFAVMNGDLCTSRDAARLSAFARQVVQINTGRGCHLEAQQVRQALDQLDLAGTDVLFIENVGNLICPVGFDLGQTAMVGMFSVAEGDDKAAKHPQLVCAADLLLLNKCDLASAVTFDRSVFDADIRRLRPEAVLLDVAARAGRIDPWLEWLRNAIRVIRSSCADKHRGRGNTAPQCPDQIPQFASADSRSASAVGAFNS